MRSVMNGDVIVHFTVFFFLGVVWIKALKPFFGVVWENHSAILKLSLNRMRGMPSYICCDTSIQFLQRSMFRVLKIYSYY